MKFTTTCCRKRSFSISPEEYLFIVLSNFYAVTLLSPLAELMNTHLSGPIFTKNEVINPRIILWRMYHSSLSP